MAYGSGRGLFLVGAALATLGCGGGRTGPTRDGGVSSSDASRAEGGLRDDGGALADGGAPAAGDAAIACTTPGEAARREPSLGSVAPGVPQLVAGDVDGDGDPDLLVASLPVAVLRQDRPGVFTRVEGPRALLASHRAVDLDGDGRRDLLGYVADDAAAIPTNLVVLAGDGHGAFRSGPSVGVFPWSGTLPPPAVVAQVTGDPRPDVVLIHDAGFGGGTQLVVQRQDGATFAEAQRLDAPETLRALHGPYDLDGDGDLDLLAATDKGARLVDNQGGRLAFGRRWERTDAEPAPMVADTDGDGDLDLVPTRLMAAARRAGVGGFVGARDMDGDGVLDLVGWGLGVRVLLDRGPDGHAAGEYPARAPQTAALIDGDGDGDEDVAVVVPHDGRVEILANRGDGTFARAGRPVASPPESMLATDVDGDGDLDLVVAGQTAVEILLNDGRGAFASGTTLRAADVVGPHGPAMHEGIAIGDFDGDGRPDLAVALQGGAVVVHRQVGALAYERGTVLRLLAPGEVGRPDIPAHLEALEAADLDGDGRLDLATTHAGPRGFAQVLWGNGDGTFAPGARLVLGDSPESLVTADVDRDGRLDLVAANEGSWPVYAQSGVMVLRNAGARAFAPDGPYAVGGWPDALAVGDLDGDGFPEIVTANARRRHETVARDEDSITVLRNDGAGRFVGRQELAVGAMPRAVAIADVDGDGRRDVVTGNAASDDVTVLRGDGAGKLEVAFTWPAGIGPQGIVVADFDGACGVDVVVASRGSAELTVLTSARRPGGPPRLP